MDVTHGVRCRHRIRRERDRMGRRLVAAFLLLLAAMPTAAAPPPPSDTFLYGVSWYPEWKDPAGWDADLAAMRANHFTYVRVAEFAWARMEPREGAYDFAWLDAAIAAAARHGLKVLIGTPTAAPPAWLTTRYPEVLLVDANGKRAEHGGRRQFSVGSALYRAKAAGIAGRLAARYGRNPAVIGFQIDNEYGRDTADKATRGAFQAWLKAKYGTLAALNRAWFTVYWSRTYDDWAQIGIPDATYANPPLRIDWLRFWSEAWAGYQRAQIDAIRPLLGPGKVVTTNFVAQYDNFDYSVPAQDLDVVGWDWYAEGARLDPAEGAMLHDLYRGFLGRNPWILESAPGNIVFVARNHFPPKGQTRAMVWQAVGHGADSYSYWLWQTPPGGNEPLHGSMVDTSGRPRPILAEVAAAGAEVARAWPALRGTTPVAEAAMLHDYPSRWSIRREPLTKDYDPWAAHVRFHRALAPVVGGIDVLRAPTNLARYRIVVAANLHMVDAAGVAALTAYVRGGGHLVLGPRAGERDEHDLVWTPGPFEALLGARVDHYAVPATPVALDGPLGQASATLWTERLLPLAPGLETWLRYGPGDGWLDGEPGVVSRTVGRGRITYIGAWLDQAALDRVVAAAARLAGATPLLPGVAADVEVTAREGGGHRTLVVVNWGATPATLPLPRPMRDLLAGTTARQIDLPPFGVAALGDRP